MRRDARGFARDERVLGAIFKTGAGRRFQPSVQFGTARGRGHNRTGKHRGSSCGREEDPEEASRERHL